MVVSKSYVISLIIMPVFMIACDKGYDVTTPGSASSGTNTTAGSNGNGGTTGTISTGGTTTTGTGNGNGSTGLGVANNLPHVTLQAPPCNPMSNCVVTFVLTAPAQYTFEFNWQTNDRLYQTTPPAGDPPYGQPNVQYVPVADGTITFQAGETTQTGIVKDINPDNTAISIGLTMFDCSYNGVVGPCNDYF